MLSRKSLRAIAAGTTEEPAKMSALKFPSGTPVFFIALFFFPARNYVFILIPLVTEEKEDLAFDVGRDFSPPLLITMYRFNGYAQNFCELFLRLAKSFSVKGEFFCFHLGVPSFVDSSYPKTIIFPDLSVMR